jgi:hypothetical protein
VRPDHKDNSQAIQQKQTRTNEVQDIKDLEVSDKDASALKGGRMPLNPQPLPPRY